MVRFVVLLLPLALGCGDSDSSDGGDSDADTDADTDSDSSAGGQFGDDCSEPANCESGVCFEFGDGSNLCSSTCTADDQCPDGSRGHHCNEQGYCRP